MNTNEVLKKIHKAAVQKAAVKCAVDGSARSAVEIGNAIIAYGQKWTEGIADDGKLSEAEIGKIQDAFELVLDRYVPALENSAVDIVYNGVDSWLLRLLGVSFQGLKHYLNKWFGLNL